MNKKYKSTAAVIAAMMIFSSCTDTADNEISQTEQTSAFSESVTEAAQTAAIVQTTLTEESTIAETSAPEEADENETMLQQAIDKGIFFSTVLWECDNVVFSDIDYDNFPEMILYPDAYDSGIFKYNGEVWVHYLGDFSDEYENTEICVYYDRENDCNFIVQIYDSTISDYSILAEKITLNKDGTFNVSYLGDFGDIYPIGYYWDNEGWFAFFSGFGKFRLITMSEDELHGDGVLTEYKNFVKENLSEQGYELIESFTTDKIMAEAEEKFISSGTAEKYYLDGDFADSPEASENGKYNFFVPEQKKGLLFTIGGRDYYEDSDFAFLNRDDINAENFEKLSALPRLTSLYIGGASHIDMNGIEKLKKLKILEIVGEGTYSVENGERLAELKELEVLFTAAAESLDFLADMDSVRVLRFWNEYEMPAEHIAPVCEMDGLEYITIETSDGQDISSEQQEYIKERRPDIKLCYYKRG